MSELRDEKNMANFKAKLVDTLSNLPPKEAADIYRKTVDYLKGLTK